MNKMLQLTVLVICLLFLHVGLYCEQITIGAGNLTERIPVDMHSMNSLYQCIYLQSEMGISSGTISRITFYNAFTTPMYYKPIKVWLGTSEQTSLTQNGWIPSSQLTMVYDGSVHFYYGQNSIVLDLPMGYYYHGGSLVLMVQRPMDTTSYGLENKFYCQSSSFNRSLRISSDSTVLSPLVPPTTGATLSGLFPKTTFTYANSGFAVVNTGIQQSMDGSHSWADSNGDGMLDLLATGSGGAEVYINNGTGGFVPVNAGFTGVSQSAGDWGDYDNDGDLDVAISGNAGGTLISKIYRNNSNNSYTDIGAGLIGLYDGSVNWADYDNDGDLDLLLTGNPLPTGYAGLTILYRNDGNNIFTDAQTNLPGVSSSDASWGDMDNDGDLDLLLAGNPNSSPYLTKVFRNDGYGSFADIGADLIQVVDASVQWGDQDGDGDLDILYTGQYETGSVIRFGLLVYNNNGSSVFTEASTGLIGTNYSYARWGDYDNDGDLDIFYDRHSYSVLYRNNGNSTYEVAYTLPSAGEIRSTWGDFDNDGDLDIVLNTNIILRNELNPLNTPPSAPANLRSQMQGTDIMLFWDESNDAQTSAGGLSYALKMGTQPGDCDVISPQSADSGFRLIPMFGSSNSATGWKLRINESSPESNYYWSVQAIDSAFSGSPFSATSIISPLQLDSPNGGEELVVGSMCVIQWSSLPTVQNILLDFSTDNGQTWVPIISNPYLAEIGSYNWFIPNIASISCLIRVKSAINDTIYDVSNTVFSILPAPDYSFLPLNTSLAGVITRSVKWGDLDNDSDLDIFIIGTNDAGAVANIYRNNGSGNFSLVAANLPGVYYGNSALGDYDNDGDLDIALSGSITSNYQERITRVYRNDGNMTFTNVNAALPGVYYGTMGWGDCDNDGDLDLFLSGISTSGANLSNIYRNDQGSFSDLNANLFALGYYFGACAWGDYDFDGDLDLIYSGSYFDGDLLRLTKLYKNMGNGEFIDQNANLTSNESGSIAWGDADSDGDLDLILSGYSDQSAGATLYSNDNGTEFTPMNCNFPVAYYGSVEWGDYDNDGDLDILHTGGGWFSDNWFRRTKIYRNEGNFNFTDINANIPGVSGSDTDWGDYDNDGDLDILLVGHDGNSLVAKVYRNLSTTANSAPTAPTNLSTTINNDYIEFSWDESTDAQTPSSGLSYMLRIGTSSGGSQICSPMASSAGFRKVPIIGIALGRCYWKILASELPATYYWSVQAIDTGLLGSAFAIECISSLPPEVPHGIEISIQGNNATISWQPVTEDMAGNPMQVHTYLVYCSVAPDGDYTLIGQTSALLFSHVNALQTYQRHFYKIVAVSGNPVRVFSEGGLPKILGKPINNVRE